MGYAEYFYCVSACWDSENGYDGVTENGAIVPYIDYNIGQSGGQFIIQATPWKMARMMMELSAEELLEYGLNMNTWSTTYFSYFGGNNGGQTVSYDTNTQVAEMFIPKAAEGSGQTVTFTEYPSKGWMGYCSNTNCEGEEPKSITLDFAYDATQTQFVYYATSDAF